MPLKIPWNRLPSCGSGCKRGVQFLQLFPCTVQVVGVAAAVLFGSGAGVVYIVVRIAFAVMCSCLYCWCFLSWGNRDGVLDSFALEIGWSCLLSLRNYSFLHYRKKLLSAVLIYGVHVVLLWFEFVVRVNNFVASVVVRWVVVLLVSIPPFQGCHRRNVIFDVLRKFWRGTQSEILHCA